MAGRRTTLDTRTPAQIREHYEIEKELTARLLTASRTERKGLYTAVYEELYRRVPHHMKLTEKTTEENLAARVNRQLRWLSPALAPDKTLLEVGAGDCAVTIAAAPLVKKSIAVEVSQTIAHNEDTPQNFELLISDGTSIPVPPESVDVVYSQQLMEHLHPEDALEQLRNIFRALRPGGKYYCATPNALTGPHDVSRHFDDVPSCFHLKEYRISELADLFGEAGFRRSELVVSASTRPRIIPVWPARLVETVVVPLPRAARLKVAPWIRPRILYTFRLLGTK